jgi:multidrug transporter EmrE-like cation transporter
MGYLFVALTVLLTVYGQFVIKWQVLRAGALPPGMGAGARYLALLLVNPWVLSGLAAAFAASLCWMVALTKLPLSQAYPYTAASFVLVVIGGAWLFSEPLSVGKVLGAALIGIGVIVVGLK